jgi:hypothetical protein
MLTYRTLLRTVAPPVLALGLTALMVHPLEAVQAAPIAAPAAAPVPAAMLGEHSPASASGSLSVGVPAVAFQQHATLTAGRLRTAALVNVAEPGGTVSIAGISGCTVTAEPGAPAWLDCPYAGAGVTVRVSVTLTDGRTFAQDALPVVAG